LHFHAVDGAEAVAQLRLDTVAPGEQQSGGERAAHVGRLQVHHRHVVAHAHRRFGHRPSGAVHDASVDAARWFVLSQRLSFLRTILLAVVAAWGARPAWRPAHRLRTGRRAGASPGPPAGAAASLPEGGAEGGHRWRPPWGPAGGPRWRPHWQPAQSTSSSTMASPWPPPLQMLARPNCTPRFRISWANVSTMRAPLAPMGWPSAMAPPLTLTISGSHSPSRVLTMVTTAKASLISTRPMSLRPRPALASAFSAARCGTVARYGGSAAAVAQERTRTMGLKPSARALSSFMRTRAAAPSLMPGALPAVMQPLGSNTGRSLASFSRLVSRRGASSVSTVSVPPRTGTSTGTISSAMRPPSMAASARWWLRSAHWSCSSRLTLNSRAICSPWLPMWTSP